MNVTELLLSWGAAEVGLADGLVEGEGVGVGLTDAGVTGGGVVSSAGLEGVREELDPPRFPPR